MATQLEAAQKNIITPQMEQAAKFEDLDPQTLCELVAQGKVVLPYNPKHAPQTIRAIGKQTRVKVNVNLGTSPDLNNFELEMEKLKLAHELKADAVMDLSIGSNLAEIRARIIEQSQLPVGTVPVYETFDLARQRKDDLTSIKPAHFLETIKHQAKAGVDFMTIHAGINKISLHRLNQSPRILGIVSRGGSLLASWMQLTKQENPLYSYFAEILDIALEYDVTLSLGDALRPGCIHDATDAAQIEELIILGELANQARQKGVQVMIEGPGHVNLADIPLNMKLQNSICNQAPFYVLGPVVCDVAPGYDHITAAIGGSLAALSGADFLCYVTPAEHIRLPNLDDVRQGIIATKIAAFSADLAQGKQYAVNHNKQMALARAKLDWPNMTYLALDPKPLLQEGLNKNIAKQTCSMCGDLCAIKIFQQGLAKIIDN
ncbi:MAG: phosphomethylpyrimidine synthase ThiC [Pseudomonadota bacterium]